MSSDARIRASQLNAQKSTGPKTESGKQRSRRNSLKHGLCAEQVLLPHEKPEMLDEIRQDLIDEYQPASNWELRLIDEAAMAYVRVQRSRRFERGLFDLRLCLENQPGAATDEGIALALYTDKPERMQNFYRYNAAAERAYHRALANSTSHAGAACNPNKQSPLTPLASPATQWCDQSCWLRCSPVRPTRKCGYTRKRLPKSPLAA